MKVEILFSELYLYGDLFNAKYLHEMLPDADFIWTSYQDEPAFGSCPVDLIYIGSLPDHLHEVLVEKLRPHVPALREALQKGTIVLATGNAADLFGATIVQDTKTFPALGMFPYEARGTYELRYNSWLMGSFTADPPKDGSRSIPIIGNKSEYSVLFTKETGHALFQLNLGLGLNYEAGLEGYHDGNFYATKMLGPFLIMNPLFSEYFLHEVLKQKDAPLPHKKELLKAFNARSKKLLSNVTYNFAETNIRRVE